MHKEWIQQESERLEEKINTLELGMAYDLLNTDENGLIYPYYLLYKDSLSNAGFDFLITTNRNPNAGVLYREKLIIMSQGLIDRLSKLAELIVSSGVLDGEKVKLRYFDLDFSANSFRGFDNKGSIYETPQKTKLFHFVFTTLMSFVLHHEVGHVYHKHGERLQQPNYFGDSQGHAKISAVDAISSHARELIADIHSFLKLMKSTEEKLSSSNDFGLIEHFNDHKNTRHILLILVTCYFRMMDMRSTLSHFESTHPEAVVRAFAIYAKSCSLEKNQAIAILDVFRSLDLVKQIFSYLEQPLPNDWLDKIWSTDMLEWQKKVQNEYSFWINS